jgi:Zn-dependent protease with chaperone function
MTTFHKLLLGAGLSLGLVACGTTYSLPEIDDSAATRASKMFTEAQAEPPRPPNSQANGESRFRRVAARVMPAARRLCEQEFASVKGVDCSVGFEIDYKMPVRNAYFTYTETGYRKPVIRFTVPMLQDAVNDHEVAFILGHEYGHLIGQHIQKQDQQALAGALIVGALVAYSNAQAAAAGTYYNPGSVDEGMDLGAAIGQRTFSQTYELEADMLGTRIAAMAGYDPVVGARFFARGEATRLQDGKLSFWGTHPPDAKRLALVVATMDQIRSNLGLKRKKSE